MNMLPTIDQASIVRVPTKQPELFAKETSHTAASAVVRATTLDIGDDTKLGLLDAKLYPTTNVASGPQLTPPKLLPETAEALALLKDLEKFKGIGNQIDTNKLVSLVDQAIEFTIQSPLPQVVKVYTKSVDARIKALLLKALDNQAANQNFRSKKLQDSLDIYSKVVAAKEKAIRAQGWHAFTGSLGAAIGSGLIATGGLVIQGHALDKKGLNIKSKEMLQADQKLMREEQRTHQGLKQRVKSEVLDDSKRDAHSKITKVNADINKVDGKISKIEGEIADLRKNRNPNNDRIQALETDKNRKITKKNRLETEKQQLNADHPEMSKLIKEEKTSYEKINKHHDKINKNELEMESLGLEADREHSIGWTVVNLQSMSQAIQSGMGVQQRNEEGKATLNDGQLSALQGQLQSHEAAISQAENAKDGLKNALAEVGSSKNRTLAGLKT